MVQVIEYLPNKRVSLSSTSVPPKKNNKKKELVIGTHKVNSDALLNVLHNKQTLILSYIVKPFHLSNKIIPVSLRSTVFLIAWLNYLSSFIDSELLKDKAHITHLFQKFYVFIINFYLKKLYMFIINCMIF
jgi:hypothetical protein